MGAGNIGEAFVATAEGFVKLAKKSVQMGMDEARKSRGQVGVTRGD